MTEREAILKFLSAWDSLPTGWYSASKAQAWLNSEQMKEGVEALRAAVANGEVRQ